nr:hypothetical protein [Tanacetum cinerariifolium]
MAQNIDFSGYDQIQNPQCSDVQENPLNDEFEAFTNTNDDKMNNLEIEFDQLHTQDFQKNCDNFQMRNFLQNFQNGPPGEDKEHEATTDTKLPSTEDIQPLPVQEPPQSSNMHQIIEECCVEVSEQQKQKMEDTMFDLVKICHHKQFLCIHDNGDDIIDSALDSKLLLINSNSQRLDKKEQKVKIVEEQLAGRRNRAEKSLQNFRVIHKSSISFKNTSQISLIHSVALIQSTKEPKHLLSMGYGHFSITPETESDEVIESNAENLLPIPSKCEVTLEDEIECDMPANDDCSPVFTTFSNPLFKDNDDLDSSDDESLPDEDNLLYDNSFPRPPEELNAEIADTIIESIPLLPIPVQDDLFLSDDSIPPDIENFADDPEGDIRFLEELLIDDSILSDELSDANSEENPLISRPPPKPPDVETNAGEEIQVVMTSKDKFDDDSQIFMFDKVFSLLSAKSEDTIFDPGISD